jgi:hypothetical protein
MKLLLTSAGIANASIHNALLDLLGKGGDVLYLRHWMRPHVGHERFPENSLANVERWAPRVPAPMYAIDDQTAIKVTDGAAEVVSEGHCKLFTP